MVQTVTAIEVSSKFPKTFAHKPDRPRFTASAIFHTIHPRWNHIPEKFGRSTTETIANPTSNTG
jgi:hypothetical protein